MSYLDRLAAALDSAKPPIVYERGDDSYGNDFLVLREMEGETQIGRLVIYENADTAADWDWVAHDSPLVRGLMCAVRVREEGGDE